VLRERLTLAHEVWYVQSNAGDAVYAVVTGEAWPKGERKALRLEHVRATEQTEVEILGQSGEVLEYRPAVDARATWSQDAHALTVSAMHAQRLYNNNQWPNPIVVKISHPARPEA
jgi:alpha-L-fucosidase